MDKIFKELNDKMKDKKEVTPSESKAVNAIKWIITLGFLGGVVCSVITVYN